ncbi:hypothetical protein [Streptomyces sp. DT171]|uniref:hypothetical protein n=1 Tax=Streptomyces sp. DT171 TaxID=3416524 RepID=UPI003CEEF7CA
MTAHLGPLELVGDRWIIGDPKRKNGSCLVLSAEGMEHHEAGTTEPLDFVPWHRFMEVRVKATTRAWLATRTGGVLDTFGGYTQIGGRSACSVRGLVRHPYEDWSVNYTHHERPYTSSHVFLVGELFHKTSAEAKAAHRLGDPEWLGEAVTRLATLPVRWAPSASRRVTEIIKDLGT